MPSEVSRGRTSLGDVLASGKESVTLTTTLLSKTKKEVDIVAQIAVRRRMTNIEGTLILARTNDDAMALKLLDRLGIGGWLLDQEQKCMRSNTTAGRMTEFFDSADMLGESKAEEAVQDTIEGPETSAIDMNVATKDGGELALSMDVAPRPSRSKALAPASPLSLR